MLEEIQFFTWDSYNGEMSWWTHLKAEIPNLAAQGFTQVWVPPPNKAAKPHGQGYDAYDLVHDVICISSRSVLDSFCPVGSWRIRSKGFRCFSMGDQRRTITSL